MTIIHKTSDFKRKPSGYYDALVVRIDKRVIAQIKCDLRLVNSHLAAYPFINNKTSLEFFHMDSYEALKFLCEELPKIKADLDAQYEARKRAHIPNPEVGIF